MPKKMTTEEFIKRVKEINGDKFDYSKTVYTNQKTKVTIICPVHGEFEQRASDHLYKKFGCPACSGIKKLTTKDFIEKANKIHNKKYDYSKVEYKNNCTPVIIICPEHGEFKQRPADHFSGKGCSICSKCKKLTTKEFIKRAKEIHGDKYDYSKVKYTETHSKITIICPIHGEFEQTPNSHLLKESGCIKCSYEKRGKNKRLSLAEFVERANELHNNKYDYSKVKYKEIHTKVTIICPEHGEFEQTPNSHLNIKQGCPKCGITLSKNEEDLYKFIKKIYKGKIIRNDRDVLNGKEIDIFLPDLNLGFEYNGLIWHSEKFKDRNDLLNKKVRCEEKGINLIHIFEDEYIEKKEIVQSKVRYLLNKTKKRIFARKCSIKEITSKQKSDFLNKNHIQGNVASTVNIGLFYEEKLVAVMTFGESRFNKSFHVELLRFATLINHNVIGGFGKLLKYFEENYEVESLISYADYRWSLGNVYEVSGFSFLQQSKPSYSYCRRSNPKRFSRFKFQKHKLKNILDNFDENKSESWNMRENGFYRIFDCGNLVYYKEY